MQIQDSPGYTDVPGRLANKRLQREWPNILADTQFVLSQLLESMQLPSNVRTAYHVSTQVP